MEKSVFSIDGKELRKVQLNPEVFEVEASEGTIYYAVKNELDNMRQGTHSTKTRAEVNGSNSKPWAQKGTGRARSGDKKSPVWVGGGIIFGPKPRDYSWHLNKKMKRLAMTSILSMKAADEGFKVVEDFSIDSCKTKDLAVILKKLTNETRTVVVLQDNDLNIKRAGKNIPWLSFLSYDRLRAHDLYYGKNILVLESAVKKLNDFYGKKD